MLTKFCRESGQWGIGSDSRLLSLRSSSLRASSTYLQVFGGRLYESAAKATLIYCLHFICLQCITALDYRDALSHGSSTLPWLKVRWHDPACQLKRLNYPTLLVYLLQIVDIWKSQAWKHQPDADTHLLLGARRQASNLEISTRDTNLANVKTGSDLVEPVFIFSLFFPFGIFNLYVQ